MKIIKIISVLSLLALTVLGAQFETPVTLSAKAESAGRAGEVVNIIIKAEMEEEWKIYALRDQGEGPIASRVTVTGDAIKEAGMVLEEVPVEKYDDGFLTTTRTHQGGATFTAPVRLKENLLPGTYNLKVSVLYQVCNASLCYPPKEEFLTIPITVEAGEAREDRMDMVLVADVFDTSGNINLDAAIEEGFFSFVLLAVTMGFLALLTPCVFPMIPITVSFFTHQGELGEGKPVNNAIIYTLGIIATFSILGFILALTLGASGANQLAASPWVNLFIAALFIYFAFSLFGMYEIQLPEKLRQFSLRQEGRGGVIGTLFMAVTFTLTSFTCTVQFVGLLLVAAAQGHWFWPMIGMVVFSATFALPFFFLALFPQYLAKMPKSGGWLNSVKVVMGFLEMAAAFKFLSNTDLVWGWGFFSYNTVLAVWAVLMLMTGIYLLGKIQLPHDSPLTSISVPRLMLSTVFLTFGLYLTSGLFGQRIHGLIYSYLPPIMEGEYGTVRTGGASMAEEFTWYRDLDKGLAEAKATGKPVFIDFTGYTCTNCRWMEANAFTKAEVKNRFREMILVQLYTDGGPNHRENQEYEIERFGTAALPYYVILSPYNEVITTFPGMTRNLDDFLDFLDVGLAG
ncbi:MAG: cytochrome c biogenesis protein CcdA [Candidatus Marinimicrobia bacterium]|jgi:thiol:disulfide interchange protein DsbD|nr:cytochrome c biogenesis protein CcdA [Candidatus Neomarinimicrobiota bacterium]MDP6611755.1 cytochrome c biogenesis protein CcdA [Candidatus Neomarinimicrobiota bacterium]|tara:strand:- start:88318 stop:90192 length:1875 start_codon:yes stop_codon:yes gene_type:complete